MNKVREGEEEMGIEGKEIEKRKERKQQQGIEKKEIKEEQEMGTARN